MAENGILVGQNTERENNSSGSVDPCPRRDC